MPSVDIQNEPVSVTTTDPFTVTFAFSEDVTGFDIADIAVANGSVANFLTVDASTYTADITPDGNGAIAIDVAAGAAQDAAGNPSTAAPQAVISFDSTPTETLRIEAEDMVLANGYEVENGLTFASGSALIRNLAPSGTSATATSQFSGQSGTYEVRVGYHDESDGESLATVNVGGQQFNWTFNQSLGGWGPRATNFVERVVGEVSLAPGDVVEIIGTRVDGELARIDYIEFIPVSGSPGADTVAPTVDIQNEPVSVTTTDPFTVTFAFSEAVTGFDIADIAIANGTVANFLTVDASTYTAEITPDGNGSISIDVAAGAAQDAAGNPSTAAPQAIISFETPPTQTLFIEAESLTLAGGYVVESGINVASNSAVIRSNAPSGTPATATTQFSGESGTYEVRIGYFDEADGNSTGTVNIGGTVFNLSFNQSLGGFGPQARNFVEQVLGEVSLAQGDVVEITGIRDEGELARFDYIEFIPTVSPPNGDTIAPTVDIQNEPVSVTTTAPFSVTFAFSEAVTGFDIADIAVVNGTVANFLTVDASTYTAEITPDGNGSISIDVAAGAAQDAAGNPSTAAPQAIISFETPP
ncbi:MAG: Ig-like domain-containing protein, partial [Synechococcus sp.]